MVPEDSRDGDGVGVVLTACIKPDITNRDPVHAGVDPLAGVEDAASGDRDIGGGVRIAEGKGGFHSGLSTPVGRNGMVQREGVAFDEPDAGDEPFAFFVFEAHGHPHEEFGRRRLGEGDLSGVGPGCGDEGEREFGAGEDEVAVDMNGGVVGVDKVAVADVEPGDVEVGIAGVDLAGAAHEGNAFDALRRVEVSCLKDRGFFGDLMEDGLALSFENVRQSGNGTVEMVVARGDEQRRSGEQNDRAAFFCGDSDAAGLAGLSGAVEGEGVDRSVFRFAVSTGSVPEDVERAIEALLANPASFVLIAEDRAVVGFVHGIGLPAKPTLPSVAGSPVALKVDAGRGR